MRARLADDAVVRTGREFDDLTDRVFQLRCGPEDVPTAVVDGATSPELHRLATDLITPPGHWSGCAARKPVSKLTPTTPA